MIFGGSDREPFYALLPERPAAAGPFTGTSFASPFALRVAADLRAHFGPVVRPLALKALMVHRCECCEHERRECGWGRIPDALEELVVCAPGTAYILYQGTLSPAQWLKAPIPLPAGELTGPVAICAMFCFATEIEPEHPVHYTRAGLAVVFRPHSGKRKTNKQLHPDAAAFFRSEHYLTEGELRRDAHKWEPTLNASHVFKATKLKDPVFNVHYNARAGGEDAASARPIPYALVVTVRAIEVPDLYDRILHRYRTQLEPLRPVIEIPIRVQSLELK